MYENYYSERIYNELVDLNETSLQIKSEVQTLNESCSLLIVVLFAIGVLKGADMLHHLIDATYKFGR